MHVPARRPLGLGIIGAGSFGRFVAEAAAELADELCVIVVADGDIARAQQLSRQIGARPLPGLDALLGVGQVEAVVIATPPVTHAALSVAALEAGRHVFCEKPTALSTADAERVREAAAATGCTYLVDHVLRYNPVLAALARLRAEGLLGPIQRLSFDNDAADEDLPAGHWFWDEQLSGGIFLEHGVHFFDAAALLLDAPPSVVQALGATRRDGTLDTVSCTVRHADGALAGYTHGFSHAHRAERQLMRLDHGLAEVRVHGWIPLRAEIDGWTGDADGFEALPRRANALLRVSGYRPSGREDVQVRVTRDAAPASARARGIALDAPHHVSATIDLGWPAAKQSVYRESVRAALYDFAHAARTHCVPRAGIAEGGAAVAVAAAATASLRDGRTHSISFAPFRSLTHEEDSCPVQS